MLHGSIVFVNLVNQMHSDSLPQFPLNGANGTLPNNTNVGLKKLRS